ncbi:MFS transporter [Mesobacillus subterraneus]|uniref:MFS transporter n=1 Tax=Mesobacillus subterraneus TaxID=285983 RepID=UPI00203A966D|nr:MFS transporter [Mesobacillus subterraneus]MCM3666379.1 MFS transporter [Mesobacillus subterraneus]MCM3685349.1 MFS transporter [Mesobacillus subterraneus]
MSKLNKHSKLLLLRTRQLRHLLFARSISILGDMLTPIALAFAVLDFSNSASALGIVLAARALPSLVLMLFGGVIGDRFPRRMIMILSNIVGFITQGLIGFLLITNEATVLNVAILTAIRGATGSFFNPASTGAIAHVAPNGKRQETFALFAIAGNIAEISGPALAGATLMFVSPGWVLVADACTFLISALLISACGPLGEPNGKKKASVIFELKEGLSYVLKKQWLTVLILSASLFQFFLLSSLNVLGPLVANNQLGGAQDWAIITTALGLGSITGSFLAMYYKPKNPLLMGYLFMLFGSGPTLFLLSMPAPLEFIVVSEFLSGVAISFFSTLESVAIARFVPNNLLSRVDSINRFGSLALKPLGMAMVGPAAAFIGVETTLIFCGAISLLAVAWPLAVPSIRKINLNDESIEEIQVS